MDNLENKIIEKKDFPSEETKISDILKEVVDDSWVHEIDKKNLIDHIKKLYKEKFTWADNILMKVLVKRHYNETIKGMNKEEYLKEKEDNSADKYLEDLNTYLN
jgi:hypothetical protein